VATVVPSLLSAKVMHKRLFPKVNQFCYSVYYVMIPLSKLDNIDIAVNKHRFLSFWVKDHGDKKGGDLRKWADAILTDYQLDASVKEVVLVTMPRVCWYVFNPVSFWLCLDDNDSLRAVICQVNNTFGESHSYVCAHSGGDVIHNDDWLEAKKLFHVSPFLEREGHYQFRFSYKQGHFGAWIDYYDATNNKTLLTSMVGEHEPLTKVKLYKQSMVCPLVTFKVVFLIHLQAIKLLLKGIKYVAKPKALWEKISTTSKLTKL